MNETIDENPKENFFKRMWKWITKDKGRIGSLVFIILFIVIIIILAAFGTNLGEQLQKVLDYFEGRRGLVGIFIGVFLISIFGNSTVIFPVPYTFAIVTVAARQSIGFFETILLGICAGLGAAIGESSAWLFGKASKSVIEEGMEKQVSQAQKWFDRGLAPLIIFIFAATPLPDDAILIFVGLLSYPLWKTLIWCFLGKVILTSAISLVTKLFVEYDIGEKVFWLFGITHEGGELSTTPPNPLSSALVWIATILLIGVVLFINWEVVWKRITNVFYKIRLLKFLNIANDPRIQKLSKSDRMKSPKSIKETFYWDSKIEEEIKSNVENSPKHEYLGFLTVDYISKNPLDITPDMQWYREIKNKTDDCIEFYNITRFKVPLISDASNNEVIIQSNKFICILKIKHIKFKREFQFSYLLEDNSNLSIVGLGEKEAEAIKLVKKYPRDQIIRKIVNLLDKKKKNNNFEITNTIIATNQFVKNIIPDYLEYNPPFDIKGD